MLQGITLKTDRKEYSRNEVGKSTIRLRVVPNPTTVAEEETVAIVLKRKSGLTVHTETVTFPIGEYPKGIILAIDLNAIKDAKGIPLCLAGEYVIEAYSPAAYLDDPDANPIEAQATTPSFWISIITVEEMRKGYCFGAPIYASDTPFPKNQPVVVTGVRITKVSENTAKRIHTISFNAANNTLSWSGGGEIPIGGDTEILPGQRGDYAEVEIDSFELPAVDAAEGIVIDKEDFTDERIRTEISRAVAEVEAQVLKLFIEPKKVATEPFYSNPGEGEHFDELAQPVMYTSRDFNVNGIAWSLSLPYHQLQSVEVLEGHLGGTRALYIQSGAFAVNQKAGLVDVLPYDSQYAFLYTFFVQMRLWGAREYIEGFWRYKATAGLLETPGDVLKLIGYKAAITILTIAGQAYRGGFSSESMSKDGVSRSVSYTASATFGIYSATTTEYKDWIKNNQKRIAQMYRGIAMVVL